MHNASEIDQNQLLLVSFLSLGSDDIVPDKIGTLSQVGTKKISKGGWTI